MWYPKVFWGQRKYEWTEVSSSCPAELIVADEWVSHPANDEQKEYSEAEAVYRKFVYDNLLGAVTVLVIAGFILFVILEIRLWLLEQTLKKHYEQADME